MKNNYIGKYEQLTFLHRHFWALCLENSASSAGWGDSGRPLSVFNRTHGFLVCNEMPAEAIMPTFPMQYPNSGM